MKFEFFSSQLKMQKLRQANKPFQCSSPAWAGVEEANRVAAGGPRPGATVQGRGQLARNLKPEWQSCPEPGSRGGEVVEGGQ